MATIIKERERKTYSQLELWFYEKATNELRYGFPCDAEGNVNEPSDKENCIWWKNYLFVKDNNDFYSRVKEVTTSYSDPAIAICECGKEIELAYDAEECPYCGRLHNLFGQELLPRHMWGKNW